MGTRWYQHLLCCLGHVPCFYRALEVRVPRYLLRGTLRRYAPAGAAAAPRAHLTSRRGHRPGSAAPLLRAKFPRSLRQALLGSSSGVLVSGFTSEPSVGAFSVERFGFGFGSTRPGSSGRGSWGRLKLEWVVPRPHPRGMLQGLSRTRMSTPNTRALGPAVPTGA